MRITSVWLIAVLGTILAGGPVDAAEWYAQGDLSQEFSFDDNFRFSARSDDAESRWSTKSTANVNVGASTPNLQVRLNSVFDYTYFPQESSLNSADQRFNLDTTYQLERATLGLGASFVRDTTRTSDEEDTGLFIEENKRRELYRVGPNWTYQLSPLDSVNMYGDYVSVTRSTKDLDSYSQYSGGFGWTRQLTARTQIQARFSGFHFNTGARGDRKTSLIGFEIGGTHDFSERWQASFFAGPRYTWLDGTVRFTNSLNMRERISDNDDDVGYLLDANVRYQAGERTSLVANASRDVSPSTTTGIIRQTTAFGLFFNHQLLEKVAVDLSGRYSIQETLAGPSDLRRDYASVSPGVRWRLTEDLTLRCSYRFRWQKFDESGETANSNAVFATLTYQLPRLSASR